MRPHRMDAAMWKQTTNISRKMWRPSLFEISASAWWKLAKFLWLSFTVALSTLRLFYLACQSEIIFSGVLYHCDVCRFSRCELFSVLPCNYKFKIFFKMHLNWQEWGVLQGLATYLEPQVQAKFCRWLHFWTWYVFLEVLEWILPVLHPNLKLQIDLEMVLLWQQWAKLIQ